MTSKGACQTIRALLLFLAVFSTVAWGQANPDDSPEPQQAARHHTLKVTGPAAQNFLNLLARCARQRLIFDEDGETVVDRGNTRGAVYTALRRLKDDIIAAEVTIVINAIEGPSEDVHIDTFEDPAGGETTINGPVDMNDIKAFPDDIEVDRDGDGVADSYAPDGTWMDTNDDGLPDAVNPAPPDGRFLHAETECSMVAHILGERFFAVQNATDGEDYDRSHDIPAAGQGGQGAANAVRTDRPRDRDNDVNVRERAGSTPGARAGDGFDGTVSYDDGSSEVHEYRGPRLRLSGIRYRR